MKILCFVTGNKGKVVSASSILSKFGVEVVQKKLDISEPRSFEVEEVAKEKAKQAIKLFPKPLFVEDSGLYVPALNGFPKTHVNLMLETIGVEGLLKLLEGVSDRGCAFRYALAYAAPERELKLFTCIERGTITEDLKDPCDFGWSELYRVFVPKDHSKTLSEMTKNEYQAYEEKWNQENSHFKQFGEWFSNH